MNYLFVNCFGRGGSAMLMSMLSASPDVIRGEEWHRVVFGPRRVGKAIRLLRGATEEKIADRFVGRWSRHVLERRWAHPVEQHGQFVALKVMDHYTMFNDAIAGALRPGQARFIAFIRHPIGVCESLMRSGMTIKEAIDWYLAVMARIETTARTHQDYIVYRFEDLLCAPERFAQRIYHDLGLQPPSDGTIELKMKRYGAGRSHNEDASLGYSRVAIAELSEHLDRDVNLRAIQRLGPTHAARVEDHTAPVAARWYGHAAMSLTAIVAAGDRPDWQPVAS